VKTYSKLFAIFFMLVLIGVMACTQENLPTAVNGDDGDNGNGKGDREPKFAIHFDGEYILRIKGVIFEKCQNDTLVLNGSLGPITKIAMDDLIKKDQDWYELDLYNFVYAYTRITFIYDQTWHYHTLTDLECPVDYFDLVNVEIEQGINDQWFKLERVVNLKRKES